jgi:MATE family multidrug resistance protein
MRRELRAMASLAWPVILAEIGWVLMGIVDTIIVGPLGPAAIGAVGTGSTMFFAVMVLGIGTLFALDTFVAHSYGAGRLDDCHRWLYTGLQLATVMSVLLVAAGLVGVRLLSWSGIQPDVLALLQPYLTALLWSAPPLLYYTVLRRYLQAMNVVRPILWAVVVANLINAGANVVLVYGHLGAPAMGVIGSAYATLIARVALVGMFWWVVAARERAQPTGLSRVPFQWRFEPMWRLARLGAPAALQIALEVGVFAAAAALAGRISAAALAANQIVLNIAGFFFMVPFGLSSAAAVRVGQSMGRGDVVGVRRAGWSALGLAFAFALIVATLFVATPAAFIRIFTSEPSVLQTGALLLLACAVFQPFDSFQAVSTGALRGLGDTRTPMLANLAGHWCLGLPLGYVLCFMRGWGVFGLWVGLCTGLIAIGSVLVIAWHVRSRRPEPHDAVVQCSSSTGSPGW